jgi:hypothetical protein
MTPIDWIDIQSEYHEMERMSCVPAGIRKVRADHVFDENQSVLWNRKQVEDNNQRFQEEVARLNTEKNKRRDAIYEKIYKAIQDEVGHGLTRKKAVVLWNLAYERGHAYGIKEVKSYLDELMELAALLLDDMR